ncbi:PorV/PorQ family protein [Rhodocytophaga aerolata]|uniref:PorV/PorQ family protein n=1 Tax=Rhodocytophaga aerolata TaxID=455078 RepID=A0ABT8R3Z3_9BACT|nr:PorV/PorQ family protein [Rhodocytophaga aerolata]MDO1446826.1 PorV/PorQ family protein [Rhodocytophaga aerolata]
MRFTILFCLLTCLLPGFVTGQTRAPKYSNEFLSIGVGARALGMSRTQVALANDVTAGYWNPAGLLDIKNKYEFSLMHSEYFAGIAKYDYAAFATPVDSLSHIAVSVIRFGVDDIPDTRFLYDANGAINYDNITFFSAADYAFIFSYARRLPFIKGLKAGANFKVIHRNVGSFANAWGFGLDAGAQLERKNWRFGIMARDITSTFNAWSHNTTLVYDTYVKTGNEIPQNSIEVTLPKLIAGVARSFTIKDKVGILATADLDVTFDGMRNVLVRSGTISIDPHIGLEVNYEKLVFLRMGAGNVQRIKDFDSTYHTTLQPDFGVGFRVNKFTIDYALTDIGDRAEALYSHVFSVKASFK